METVTVRMARGERSTPWGFGVTEAPNRDVVIVNVVGGSLADRAGLRDGDVLDQLEGLGSLDINAVDRLLVTSRDKIELIVHRAPSSGQARIWRPEVTEQRHNEERPYRVSLEHNSDTRPPQGFNTAALPFNTDPRVKHLQYNSPMNLYSDESATEQYVQQTAGIIDNGIPPTLPRQSNEPAYLHSETLRLLKEEESKSPGNLSDHPNPAGLPVCYVCNRPIMGVMARAAGHDLHADCLSCATCGSGLRNVGHHFIDEKFYCDTHGRQKRGQGPAMDAALAAKSSPTSAHPLRPVDTGRAFYQPEVMARRPLSVSPTPQHATHVVYGTPKTHGTLSPSLRGVPSSVNYGTGHHVSSTTSNAVDARSAHMSNQQQQQQQQHSPNPPPMPSNPPPESRVPPSVRSAVSPRRSATFSGHWPPTQGLPTFRYWQIDPASVYRKEKENELTSLHEMIEATYKEDSSLMQLHKRSKLAAQKERPKVLDRSQEEIDVDIVINGEELEGAASTAAEVLIGDVRTVIHALDSPALGARFPREELPLLNYAQEISTSNNDKSATVIRELERIDAPITRDDSDTLKSPNTTDTSTSPIPTIHLPRRQSATTDSTGIIRALSPVPYKKAHFSTTTLEEHEEPCTPMGSGAPVLNSCVSLVGVNTTPRPFTVENCISVLVPEGPHQGKPQKRVDFSRATVIPHDWEGSCEVTEESIAPQMSPTSPDPRTSPAEEMTSMGVPTSYDGDVSETNDNKSDVASTLDTEVVDEHEEWMREELELARKEELAQFSSTTQIEMECTEKEEWRQQAMALLNDESQLERDIAIVTALNERLQGLRGMEEADRQKAIECIQRHQINLGEQQEQLSGILDSAIKFLKNLDTSTVTTKTMSPPLSPSPTLSDVKTDGLCEVIEELQVIPQRYKGPSDYISEKLERISLADGQTFTRSTFEQHSEQRTTTGGAAGGNPPPPSKPIETRTHSSFNNRTPYCEACKQQIRGAFVLATGLAWCPDHFVCAHRGCGRRLLECGFVEENGNKYCEGCFEAHIAPRCAKCSKPIISDCVNAMQKKWHPTCFTCAHCFKPFGNAAFYLENGLPYCEQDWNMLFTTKCVSCKYPIEAGDRWVEALGNAYHSNCFNCTRCHSNLEGESFFAKNGQPYCKMHA